MSIVQQRAGRVALAFLVLVLAACGGDDIGGPPSLTAADVAGSYQATTLTTTTAGATTNVLAAGGELAISLALNGTTTGRLFIPEEVSDGEGDSEESLSGTWSLDAGSAEVDFDHAADTFVRDMTFVAVRANNGIELRGQETFGNARINLVMTRQ